MTPPTDRSVIIEHLTKRYGDHTVVDDLSFSVAPGRVTGFLGPNGSGKSTTMKMMLDLASADRGRATIGGQRYRDLDDPARTVGAMIEFDAFHPGRSGRNHLRVLADATGIPHHRVDEVLEEVGLADAARRNAGAYSLGMRQRLGLAGALLGEPPVLILDEPGNGLDPKESGRSATDSGPKPPMVARCSCRAIFSTKSSTSPMTSSSSTRAGSSRRDRSPSSSRPHRWFERSTPVASRSCSSRPAPPPRRTVPTA